MLIGIACPLHRYLSSWVYGISLRNALNLAAVAHGRSAARYFSLRQNYCPLNLELAWSPAKVNAVWGNCCGARSRQKLQRLREILVDAHMAYGCVAALMNKACVAWKHATYFGASYLFSILCFWVLGLMWLTPIWSAPAVSRPDVLIPTLHINP